MTVLFAVLIANIIVCDDIHLGVGKKSAGVCGRIGIVCHEMFL